METVVLIEWGDGSFGPNNLATFEANVANEGWVIDWIALDFSNSSAIAEFTFRYNYFGREYVAYGLMGRGTL